MTAAIALIWANSPWRAAYDNLVHAPIGLRVAGLAFERSLEFLVNDGLMVVFFFVVGLEIKREVLDGELADPARRRLPVLAASAGMAVPALFYMLASAGHAEAQRGWAIPAATDIAFAVGVLGLIARRAPPCHPRRRTERNDVVAHVAHHRRAGSDHRVRANDESVNHVGAESDHR